MPIKAGTGIGFAPRGDITVANNITSLEAGICRPQGMNQALQPSVLNVGIGLGIGSFQLNANGKVVAIGAVTPHRLSGMPGALIGRNELHNLAVSAQQEVRRHLQMRDTGEVGMQGGIKRVGKQRLDVPTPELTRGQ